MAKKLYSVNEICEMLSMGKTKIYLLLEQGKIPAIKLGRHWRIPEEWLNESIEKAMHGNASLI